MKRIITSLAIMVLAFVAFTAPSFANNQQDTMAITVGETVAAEDEDALHCKTTFADGSSAECWLCKCPMTQAAAVATEDMGEAE